MAHGKREPTWGWRPDRTVLFNAYLLSPRAAAAVLWKQDVSARSEPLRKRWLAPHGQLTFDMGQNDPYRNEVGADREDFGV